MTVRHRIVANLYKDSVALMAISSKLMALDGVDAASVIMATPANLENLAVAGLDAGPDAEIDARPSDLVVAVGGSDEACEAALALADELLAEQPETAGGAVAEASPTSIAAAVARDPSVNLALISVPGPYAGAEALKALRLGLNVMVFSDNVPTDQELAIKRYATDHGLMVMGPDCGTAIINGLPLGFANVVRRGPIGVVAASGTGLQEVTSRIHNLGSGVSQALGTGGHDLSEEIGALSMLAGLRALGRDPQTEVIVLVSKPPAPAVADLVLEVAGGLDVPVVVIFLGRDPATLPAGTVLGAGSLAEAADLAVALAHGRTPERVERRVGAEPRRFLDEAAARLAPSQRYVRGIFCGGTFCFEAQLVAQAEGITAFSNAPVADNPLLADLRVGQAHTIVDMGADEFTQGRPHPMIDPTLRDERVRQDAADVGTAVLLLDVVLGYGSADDPLSGLITALAQARDGAAAEGRHLAVVAHVCGTDEDPQRRHGVIARLEEADVFVASTNAEAATWAAYLVNRADNAAGTPAVDHADDHPDEG